MSFLEIFSGIKDILVGAAAATTAVVAYRGLKSWSLELKGKADFEAARNLVRATYSLRDALQTCRAPFYSAYEFPEPDKISWDGPGQADPSKWAYVYKNRFSPVLNALQEFDSHVLEVEALWGSEIKAKTDQIRDCVRELNAAMEADIGNKRSQGADFKNDPEFAERIKGKVTYQSNDKTNEFSIRIRTAVKEIEGQIQPHLRRNT